MLDWDSVFQLGVTSIMFSSWKALNVIVLGVITSPWYYSILSLLSIHDTSVVNTYFHPYTQNHYEYPTDIKLGTVNCEQYTDWGGVRLLTQRHYRYTMNEVCRRNDAYDIKFDRLGFSRDFDEEMLDRPIHWVSDFDYLSGAIDNVVEARQVMEWIELERVTWRDLTWPEIHKWEDIHYANYQIRFETCNMGDAELWMEETRELQGVDLFEYVWYYSGEGRYFIP